MQYHHSHLDDSSSINNTYGRMMEKLCHIASKKKKHGPSPLRHKTASDNNRERVRQERNKALAATYHSREPSDLSQQEAYYQAQQQEQLLKQQLEDETGDEEDSRYSQDNGNTNDALSLLNGPRHVSFSTVAIRNYHIMLNDNPSVSSGPAIGLSWNFQQLPILDLEQ